MMRVRWAVVIPVLAFAGGLWAEEAKSALEARVAQSLKVQWSVVRYEKFAVTANPALSENPRYSNATVTLWCQAEVCDPNLVLGIGRDWVITQMTDAKGKPVTVPTSAQSPYQRYEPLHYNRRQLPPPPVPRWRIILASLLRRPRPSPAPPQVIYELQPYRTSFALRDEILKQAGGELGSVQGCCHVLVAESLQHIDVPFEPNDRWVHLAPGVDIRVREAVWTPDFHRYWVEMGPGGQDRVRIPTVGAPLPSRLVVGQQFLGADGKPTPSGGYPDGYGIREYGASRGGERIKGIRYVIAVNPTERKIPFEFTHVPLPDPNQ